LTIIAPRTTLDRMPDLSLARTLDAPVDRVWRALTEADRLARWFWPPRLETRLELDVRVDGAYRITSDVASIEVSGRYLEVEPGQRIVETWRWTGEDAETLVTLTLRRLPDDRSELVVEHEGFVDETEVASHVEGWTNCLDRLPPFLLVE
jgi:uncharacterized protein YndB with AHSA1/START domain